MDERLFLSKRFQKIREIFVQNGFFVAEFCGNIEFPNSLANSMLDQNNSVNFSFERLGVIIMATYYFIII